MFHFSIATIVCKSSRCDLHFDLDLHEWCEILSWSCFSMILGKFGCCIGF